MRELESVSLCGQLWGRGSPGEGEDTLTKEGMRLGPWACGKVRRGTGPS